jgi:hypothetical protein
MIERNCLRLGVRRKRALLAGEYLVEVLLHVLLAESQAQLDAAQRDREGKEKPCASKP